MGGGREQINCLFQKYERTELTVEVQATPQAISNVQETFGRYQNMAVRLFETLSSTHALACPANPFVSQRESVASFFVIVKTPERVSPVNLTIRSSTAELVCRKTYEPLSTRRANPRPPETSPSNRSSQTSRWSGSWVEATAGPSTRGTSASRHVSQASACSNRRSKCLPVGSSGWPVCSRRTNRDSVFLHARYQ